MEAAVVGLVGVVVGSVLTHWLGGRRERQSDRRMWSRTQLGEALLRFCHVSGLTPRPLVDAVPKVASWRLSTLPKAVEPETVKALLASCDRRTTYGRRDFAVLTLLVRLGFGPGR